MKYLKQIAALLLAVLLVCSLSLTALADDTPEQPEPETPAGGTITIDNAVVGQTYSVYQILKLESYDTTSGRYAYKANSAWKAWLKNQTSYVTVDAQGYVTWVGGADAAAFAKLAQTYATTKKEGQETVNVTPDKTNAATSTTVSFTGLNLGYYLVDSTLGALCSLDTTNPTVIIKEKNAVPTNEKKVKEDSKTGDAAWGATNDADIGQTVEFQSTIIAQAGAENYVFHDKMSTGLTYGSVTDITLNGTAVDAKYYTTKTTDLTDDCTFEVVFTQEFCNTLKANDKIVISYTATLNNNATVGSTGNPNESKLSYGDSSNTKATTPSETKTYTWDVDILKYANGNKEDVLKDVKFVILNSDKSKVAKVDTNGRLTEWVTVPTADSTWPTGSVLTTGADGKIHVSGLDADTYYLREIEALPGFNILSGDIKFEISAVEDGTNKTLTKKLYLVTETGEGENKNEVKTEITTLEVENNSGTELPATGGVGTTLFYVVGSVLVLGAVVLLITRKRMKA